MGSVSVGRANSTLVELGRRRLDDTDLRRRPIADRVHTRPGAPGLVSPDLVGRATELRIIRSLLDDVAHGGGALVLCGEPGIGKTRLLDAAEHAASADGMRVARACGAEFEAGIGFAGLHQLLVPLFAEINQLPGRAARALTAALGLGVGRTPDRLVVLNAVLALLRHAAQEAPMLLIVDDMHFFDQASSDALGFVARRLAGSRVGLLAAMRVGSGSPLERAGLPEIELRPVRDEAAPITRGRTTVGQGNGPHLVPTGPPGPLPTDEFGVPRTTARLTDSAEALTPSREQGRAAQAVLSRTAVGEPQRRFLHLAGEAAVEPSETRLAADGCSDVTGQRENASRLVLDARPAGPEPGRSLHAAIARCAVLLNTDGDVDAAHRMLVTAIDGSGDGPDRDIPALIEALNTLSVVCHFGGRPELWVPFHRALGVLGDAVPPVLRLIAQTYADPVSAPAAALLEVDRQVQRLQDGDPDPALTVHVAMAACFVDRLAGCRDPLRRVLLGARTGSANGWAVRAGLLLAVDAVETGQWTEAERLARDSIALCEATGRRLWAWSGRSVLALVAAVRGQWDACRALTDELIDWATPRGIVALIRDAHHARSLASLGRGDYDEAFSDASAVNLPGALGTHEPHVLRCGLDLVEAAIRTHRHAAATAHATALTDAGTARLSPRLALQAVSAEALVAPDGPAVELFQEALDIPGIERWPFEVARVQLAFGERLRRGRATRASRDQLAAALDTFTRLGARTWAERAGAELRATGQTRHRVIVGGVAPLTPQELGIAELAATGLTNKEIGSRMYLSPRTVSAHLYRVFPKLGITSRAALRDALRALPASARPSQT